MFCTKCGVAIDGGVKFCPSCGTEQRYDAYGVSPAAMAATAPPPADSYYSAVIGPKNQYYYLQQFERFDQAGKASAGWHWPAFFLTFYWMLYRKLWMPALAYFLAPYLMLMVAGVFAGMGSAVIGGLFYLAYFIGVVILLPMYANAIYYNACKKKIAQAIAASPDPQRQLGELTARGGTSNVALIFVGLMVFVAVIGILAAVSIPAYQSYIARSQIAEALSLADGLKEPVASYYGKNGNCPGDNIDAPIGDIPMASSINGTYVQMVQTSTESPCAIIATMKSTGVNASIAGKKLILQMQDQSGNLSWTCYSPDMRQNVLPKACQQAPATP